MLRLIGRYAGPLFIFGTGMAIGIILALAVVGDPGRLTP